MKRYILLVCAMLALATYTNAGPPISGGGGSGAVATDTIWAAAGDLVQGTGNDTSAVLTKGAEGTILRAGAASNAYTTATYPATSVVNQLLYSSATNVIGGLAVGAEGSYLRTGASPFAPVWSTLLLPNAGTIYKLPVFSAANTMTELAAVGATGQYLRGATGAIPAWSTLTLPDTATAFKLPVYSATNVMTELAAVGATGETLMGATGAIPAWTAAPVFGTSIEAPFLILGTAATAADAGAIRLPNAAYIYAEADAAGTDISVIGVDSSEVIQIGASGASGVTITPLITATGGLNGAVNGIVGGTTPAAGTFTSVDVVRTTTDQFIKLYERTGAADDWIQLTALTGATNLATWTFGGFTGMDFGALTLDGTGAISRGGLILGDSSPDAAGEIGYDGEVKYYDAVGSKTLQIKQTQKLATFSFSGGGADIPDNTKVDSYIPSAATITGVIMTASDAVACSSVIDIWSQAYADFPPEAAQKITADAPPTMTAVLMSKDTTLTGWTKALTADTILRANVTSNDCINTVTVTLIGTIP